MTALPRWHGTLTALVTPMAADGSVDITALRTLTETQITAGIDGLVACGTTGEAATLTEAERLTVIRTVVETAAGRVPVMAGVGTQDTRTTIAAVQQAEAQGVAGTLVVTPFYNKPSAQGLLLHYRSVADAATRDVMLYNVPSRTGCDLKPETVWALAQHPRIVGIKEATGSLPRRDQIALGVDENFIQVSGDDATACAFVLMGGHGVISVTSNCMPEPMARMIEAAYHKDVATARAQHQRLVALMDVLFIEPNPLPIKAALAEMGQLQENYRLPLCPMGQGTRAQLMAVLRPLLGAQATP